MATRSGLPALTKGDIDSKQHPFKLNENFRIVSEQVAKTQGLQGPFVFQAGPFTFKGGVTFLAQITTTLSVFADNQSAKNGGLKPGGLYRTSTGQVMVVF